MVRTAPHPTRQGERFKVAGINAGAARDALATMLADRALAGRN